MNSAFQMFYLNDNKTTAFPTIKYLFFSFLFLPESSNTFIQTPKQYLAKPSCFCEMYTSIVVVIETLSTKVILYKRRGIYLGSHQDNGSLRLGQNDRHFPNDIFKCIFLNENVRLSIIISLKVVPSGQINNAPSLVQIMAWRRPGDKPVSEPMLLSLLTHHMRH